MGILLVRIQYFMGYWHTIREAGEKIRVISARNMHRKEREIYEQTV